MQSKINAACTDIHSDTLHKLQSGTGKQLHTHICYFKCSTVTKVPTDLTPSECFCSTIFQIVLISFLQNSVRKYTLAILCIVINYIP